jgi:hypothetical protein
MLRGISFLWAGDYPLILRPLFYAAESYEDAQSRRRRQTMRSLQERRPPLLLLVPAVTSPKPQAETCQRIPRRAAEQP